MYVFDKISLSEKYHLVTSIIIGHEALGVGVRRSLLLLNPFPWLYVIDVTPMKIYIGLA